ncbi:hypothetical protein [Streptomyces sp. NPDC088910]|uniref:hypothetical protein n=1 Tax=Streptomyces sp. NPDC088910 TaxID=3365911 RepID=UPI0037F27883
MDAELAALAASGATQVVTLMASDAWTQVRDRLARFLARGSGGSAGAAAEDGTAADDGTTGAAVRAGDETAALDELQLSRAELTAARDSGDADAAADIEAGWRTRLRRVLRDDPAAAAELRLLLEELAPAPGRGSVSVVNNTVNDGVFHAPVIQGRDIRSTTVHGGGPTTP